MADTPILNYKGKYDGPEIDKAVELALGLENPESCPYYVHISLSKPDYVLTIGLGDAEGNPFNHAEIDLPLESMVVNATYENGNIILHLQDGTSTEPIPISALIAGLVSETRTVAGIDLKDNITSKELRDALEVYTKDSVDQLVSDLEDTINETLDEMEQSLNDLNELTSEHDTQINKNKSDILTVKNDIAVNRATLGMQKKNLFDFEKFLTEREATFTKEGNEYTVTTNSALNTQKYYFAEENTRIIISGILTNVTSSNARISLIDTNGNVVNGYAIDATHTSTASVAAGLKFDWSSTGRFKINELMIRSADITDDTYEPYVPSVNERLVDAEESVSDLTSREEQNKSDILKAENAIAINQSTIGFQSKNILPNVQPSTEYEGITYTVNADKSITCNGTTGSTASYFSLSSAFTELPNNVDVVFSGCPAGGSYDTYALQLYEDATPAKIHWNDFGGGITGKLPKTNKGKYKGMIVIRPNQTVENLTFKPMLRYAGTDDTYEPYVPTVDERLTANENDILSAENTINGIIPKLGIRISKSLSENNWYRVFSAEKKQTARSGIIMINRAYNTTAPESYTIIFNFINLEDVFRLICKNVKTQLIDAIRIVYSTTSQHERPCYIDIHYKGTMINTVNVSMHSESIAVAGTDSTFENRKFQTSDFSVAEIPEGYTSYEFDLTGKDMFERLIALETALQANQTTVSE